MSKIEELQKARDEAYRAEKQADISLYIALAAMALEVESLLEKDYTQRFEFDCLRNLYIAWKGAEKEQIEAFQAARTAASAYIDALMGGSND